MAAGTTTAQLASYLRVSAYAIAFFDYLQTLPAEARLYRRQKGPFRLSVACILFIIVRYVGLLSIILGNTGFFHEFSPAACQRYFWLTPVFKLVLYMASQAILALRTYAVSRKSQMVLYILIVTYVACSVPEFISTFWKRVPFHNNGTCTSGNPPGIKIASLYYVGGLVYDVVTMILTSVYIFKFTSSSRTSLSQLMRMMLEDGIMYFIALCALNIINIIFFQSPNTALQPAASTLGMATTTIFSGRFVLNLSEHMRDGVSGDQTHSSRTPAHNTRGNAGGGSNVEDTGIVVRVMKNVITMNDMGQDDDAESRTKGSAGQWSGDEMA
ncbi:hypothetical protein R3P38DRAFT_2493813 [Favolaschia claudopus]|uniref:DUF6533 domain-containing protein n=1 Tax=Favolaschia claudopus TaxID=2862362 RepID=A0AAW0EAY9_9AGAR